MKTNYHTHHKFCPHAVGLTEDYVKEAIKQGLTLLGMSDHAPNKLLSDTYVRMDSSLYDDYIKDIETAKKRYKDKITVLKGVEVEYFPHHEQYYKDLRKRLDYMILGQHYLYQRGSMDDLTNTISLSKATDLDDYASTIETALATNHFDILAHPDIYLSGYEDFDKHAEKAARRIIKASIKYDVPLEYNANGVRRSLKEDPNRTKPLYPRDEFWKIVEESDAKVIFGSDCHQPSYLYDDLIKQAEIKMKSFDLNIIETIPLKSQ